MMKTKLCLLWFLLACVLKGALFAATPQLSVNIPDDGWRLWPDTKAEWKNDNLYLPDDVNLAKLPVNPPTGGWDMLDGSNGITVKLPSTVEEHYWGKFGLRPYGRDEYTYGGRDPEVLNGNYEGVSWWWRTVDVPASFAGKLVLLHIRGERQRAEIYVNHQLVGYNMIGETSFDSDISKALKPGKLNQIAIRITNPGGWMDWQDFQQITWGKYTFQRTHGFGGLDRWLTLTAHDAVYLSDTWVLNTPEARTITAHATVKNTTDAVQSGTARFEVLDPKSGAVIASKETPVTVQPYVEAEVTAELSCPKADLWDLSTPRLYTMHTALTLPGSRTMADEADKTFGFRWFEPRGIGEIAGLYLNGRKVRLYTAISWGYWGYNALWPTPELAEKEVRDAKALNLNMLNFHRNIGKEEVLAEQDKLGLLRYMEPGGGKFALGHRSTDVPENSAEAQAKLDTSGNGGKPESFGERYMEAKITRMVRQFRSHPSLVIYVIQNEIEPNLHDPQVFYMVREMHALDPSRVILTKSGISPTNQAWYPPYAKDLMVDDGTGYSGWHDKHTVGGPGVWQDDMYKGPNDFTHYIDDRKEIVDWGEMLGAAVADNSPLMLRQIDAHGGESYDLKDHQEIATAYHTFLDKWGFRTAFPTDDAFFNDLWNKCYEFWGRVLETERLCESNDILTVSGWESTAIENHSGLVDNLRNFKGDPALIAHALSPLLLVPELRASILPAGKTGTVDLYLLNETGRPVTGQLRLTLIDPKGKSTELRSYATPAFVKEQFAYPVKMAVATPVLTESGSYQVVASLEGTRSVTNSRTLFVVATKRPELPSARIGVIGGNSELVEKELAAFPQMTVEPYKDGGSYDMVIDAAMGEGLVVQLNNGSPIRNTDDPALYNASIRGTANHVKFHFDGFTPGPVKVSLYFCEKDQREAGKRKFNVAINGKEVLKDFDIFAEAGASYTALVKNFTVDAPDGVVDITVPPGSKGEAVFNAIKIEGAGKTVAVVCGGESYTDKSGQVWSPYKEHGVLSPVLLQQVKKGMPLLVLAGEEAGADAAARELAGAGAFQYGGTIPTSRASWMGGWIFVRKHPLYDGLPANEVMKGDYQAAVQACYGLMVDGSGVAIVAAYSRDHDRHIGAITFTAKLGKGTVVFHGLTGMNPVMEQRVLGNTIGYLLDGKK
jgi:beta-galactosidase